jgi:AAA15 family ATPase/GTPase
MIDSLHIQNYRLFKDLKIDKLGQVNLIAGKNNTGKTALLEVISLLASESLYWSKIISSHMANRGELEGIYGSNPDFVLSNISYNPENNIKLNDVIIENFKNDLVYGDIKNSSFNNIIEILKPEHKNIDLLFSEKKNTMVFLPFNTSFNISQLWENIDLTPQKKEVITILKIIDSKIEDIGIDVRNFQPKILIEGNQGPMPLSKFGDGLNRLFRIALCLVNAKDKTLLIDEFEAGLHHSIQKQLWEIIFKYAKEWNIQVFATTHSLDTIENYFYIASREENRDLSNYFILNRHKEITKPVYFDLSDMKFALETNLEMR